MGTDFDWGSVAGGVVTDGFELFEGGHVRETGFEGVEGSALAVGVARLEAGGGGHLDAVFFVLAGGDGVGGVFSAGARGDSGAEVVVFGVFAFIWGGEVGAVGFVDRVKEAGVGTNGADVGRSQVVVVVASVWSVVETWGFKSVVLGVWRGIGREI